MRPIFKEAIDKRKSFSNYRSETHHVLIYMRRVIRIYVNGSKGARE